MPYQKDESGMSELVILQFSEAAEAKPEENRKITDSDSRENIQTEECVSQEHYQ